VSRFSILGGLAGLLASFVVTTAAADSSGYWAISKAPDGVKAGVVFPDFSTDEFAGMALRCPPGGGGVVVSLDSKTAMKSGTKARVTLVADAAQAAFDGRAENSEMDDQTRVIVNLAASDAVLAALGKAGRIAYAINGVAVQLPTKNSRPVLAEFLSACGAQSATDPGAVDTSDQGQPSAAANGRTIDEPQLGFALRVPEGWDFNQSDEDGIKTWKLRNKDWNNGKIPADVLSATITAIARNPGSNPEQEFREFAHDYAEKLLHGGRVASFAPHSMGGLGGFIAHATGTLVQNEGPQLAVEAVVILVEPPGQYVIASAIAPSASAAALAAFGAPGGVFGPRETEPQTPPTPGTAFQPRRTAGETFPGRSGRPNAHAGATPAYRKHTTCLALPPWRPTALTTR